MADSIHTMIYWLIGILLALLALDFFWYRPYQERRETEKIISNLRHKAKDFYRKLPKWHGRGIVIAMADRYALCGTLLVITLRRIGCQLPILITHSGNELDKKYRRYLQQIPGVQTFDLAKKLHMDPTFLRGYQIRPYSLIYSPFQEVILLDADCIFLHNPEYLFQDTLYQQTGALFWKDRRYKRQLPAKVYNWVRKLIPYRKGDNRILDKKAGDYQDSGVVVIDKQRHLKTLEKLWVLSKNWESIYNYVPGDKETYWIAAEIAQRDYAFVPHYPGVIGEKGIDALCGKVLHLDTAGRMLWLNGSLFQNVDHQYLLDFSHYALDTDSSDAKWKAFGICLQNAEILELPREYFQLINEYLKIVQKIKEDLLVKDADEESESE